MFGCGAFIWDEFDAAVEVFTNKLSADRPDSEKQWVHILTLLSASAAAKDSTLNCLHHVLCHQSKEATVSTNTSFGLPDPQVYLHYP